MADNITIPLRQYPLSYLATKLISYPAASCFPSTGSTHLAPAQFMCQCFRHIYHSETKLYKSDKFINTSFFKANDRKLIITENIHIISFLSTFSQFVYPLA